GRRAARQGDRRAERRPGEPTADRKAVRASRQLLTGLNETPGSRKEPGICPLQSPPSFSVRVLRPRSAATPATVAHRPSASKVGRCGPLRRGEGASLPECHVATSAPDSYGG